MPCYYMIYRDLQCISIVSRALSTWRNIMQCMAVLAEAAPQRSGKQRQGVGCRAGSVLAAALNPTSLACSCIGSLRRHVACDVRANTQSSVVWRAYAGLDTIACETPLESS